MKFSILILAIIVVSVLADRRDKEKRGGRRGIPQGRSDSKEIETERRGSGIPIGGRHDTGRREFGEIRSGNAGRLGKGRGNKDKVEDGISKAGGDDVEVRPETKRFGSGFTG
ncbi:uncharacterized protein LOC111628395 [Centruroides sculpturatus]|uniref:uncharacterized protein LOC111628395 n=1 Tax=Centruroides sculpturatus TaxID=218467 RepID=UPI000C6E21DF|nr:uncharacterized protein LOC111628395 [Centruroides sculpturatus]